MIILLSNHTSHAEDLMLLIKSHFCYDIQWLHGDQASIFAAVEQLQDAQVILIDSAMRDWSIVELVAHCNKRMPTAPVIVLHPMADESAEREAMSCGADEVLASPVPKARLHMTLRNMLKLEQLQTQVLGGQVQIARAATLLLAAGSMPLVDPLGRMRNYIDIEVDLLKFALRFYHGSLSQVARVLGISRSTLYRKLAQYNINTSGLSTKSVEPAHYTYVSSRANQTTRPIIRASEARIS